MAEDVERQVLELIATDRIEIPISSLSGKLKRKKPKLAKAIDLSEFGDCFDGERTYARVEHSDMMKARGMKAGIETFSEKYPRYGTILKGLIEEERLKKEVHFYFGMHDNCRLTSDDYLHVMTDLGFTDIRAKELYPELMQVSRNLSRKREEERRVLIG